MWRGKHAHTEERQEGTSCVRESDDSWHQRAGHHPQPSAGLLCPAAERHPRQSYLHIPKPSKIHYCMFPFCSVLPHCPVSLIYSEFYKVEQIIIRLFPVIATWKWFFQINIYFGVAVIRGSTDITWHPIIFFSTVCPCLIDDLWR